MVKTEMNRENRVIRMVIPPFSLKRIKIRFGNSRV
jgi:hypothetical protein